MTSGDFPNRVIVTDGASQIFDPNEDSWSLTEPMKTARWAHGLSARPDGQVIATGGLMFSETPIVACAPSTKCLDSVEIFRLSTGEWTNVAPMPTTKYRHTAIVLDDGSVLVTGGADSRESSLSSAEIFNPSEDRLISNLFFPQFVTGESNKTRLLLRNPSEATHSGEIRFLAPDGSPLEVSVGGSSLSSVAFDIPGLGVFELETDGTGDLLTGAVRILSDRGNSSRPRTTLVFDLLGAKLSAPAVDPTTRRDVFVSRNSSENAGIALHNPSDLDSVVVELVLLAQDPQEVARSQLALGPGRQLARFLDEAELFQAFFEQSSEDFVGSVRINSSSGVVVLGLLQDRKTGQLVAVP